MSKPIFKIVDDLPKTSLTTRLLGALDWVVPGEYKNTVGFENMIREVTGETDEKYIQKIGERAIAVVQQDRHVVAPFIRCCHVDPVVGRQEVAGAVVAPYAAFPVVVAGEVIDVAIVVDVHHGGAGSPAVQALTACFTTAFIEPKEKSEIQIGSDPMKFAIP